MTEDRKCPKYLLKHAPSPTLMVLSVYVWRVAYKLSGWRKRSKKSRFGWWVDAQCAEGDVSLEVLSLRHVCYVEVWNGNNVEQSLVCLF